MSWMVFRLSTSSCIAATACETGCYTRLGTCAHTFSSSSSHLLCDFCTMAFALSSRAFNSNSLASVSRCTAHTRQRDEAGKLDVAHTNLREWRGRGSFLAVRCP